MILLLIPVGLLIGGLLNIIIIRLPREQRLLGWPRCTRTGAALAWWQVIPILGWLLQRGRARDGRPIDWIFPFVEVLTTGYLIRLFQLYGGSRPFFYLAFVGIVLIVTGAIDWLHRFIYTFVILGATLVALLLGQYAGMGLVTVLLGGLSAGVGFALLYILAKILFPGTAAPFGMGDVYLAIFLGIAVGLNHLVDALFYGMLMAGFVAAAIVIRRRLRPSQTSSEYLAYGAYLCLGAIFYIAIRGL